MTLYFGRSAAALAVAALSSLGSPVFPITAREAIEAPTRRKQPSKTVQYGGGWGYTKRGPGWTAAHVKRMAKKRRNQLRAKGRRS